MKKIDKQLIDHIWKLHIDGNPIYKLSEKFGIPPTTLKRYLKKFGYNIINPSRAFSSDEKEKIVHLYNTGSTCHDIAIAIGREKNSVAKYLRQQGVNVNEHRYSKRSRRDDIINMYKRGMSPKEIQIKTKMNIKTIYRFLKLRPLSRPHNSHTTDQINRYIELYNSGKSCDDIGAEIGLKDGEYIRKLLVKNQCMMRRDHGVRIPPDKELKIINEYKTNVKIKDIAADNDIHPSTVKRVVSRNNVPTRPYTGENRYNWSGGLRPLCLRIRGYDRHVNFIKSFKDHYGWRSFISGSQKDIVYHHIYPFRKILDVASTKSLVLPDDYKFYSIANDDRLYDYNNGMLMTRQEHNLVEQIRGNEHPYWKIWRVFPDFALSYFNLTDEDYNKFDDNGMIDPSTSIISLSNKKVTENIVKYNHYIGTIPQSSMIILKASVGNIIVGVVVFGRGGNKNTPKDTLELTRLCVPYYVIKPFSVNLINMSINYIMNYCPGITKVISFADSAVGHNGGVYRMAGWEKAGHTRSDYCYYDPFSYSILHKSKCRRIKNVDRTEKELAGEKGLIKVPMLPKYKYIKLVERV